MGWSRDYRIHVVIEVGRVRTQPLSKKSSQDADCKITELFFSAMTLGADENVFYGWWA